MTPRENLKARKRARLRLIALINELPLDVDMNLSVHGLPRDDFDRLPGTGEHAMRNGGSWTKEIPPVDGVSADLYTDERPLKLVTLADAFPTLRTIKGGRT